MFAPTASFKKRLFITGMSLFAIIVLTASALFFAVRQYNYYLERSSYSQRVYSSYLAVSDHTYRKLSAMAAIVADGDILDIEERYRNQQRMRDAVDKVHSDIDEKIQNVKGISQTEELDQLRKVEDVAEEIIAGSDVVRQAVERDDRDTAKTALDRLRSDEIEGRFNRLIDEALEQELQEIRIADKVTNELSDFLGKLLPTLALFFTLFGATLIYATWRALTKSLRIFEHAARSYRAGNFKYQIENIEEAEFSDLAETLNNMAKEVHIQRQKEKASQENLESLVSLRTGELERSNKKLEAISEARKQFLADISHELRTPLTIIRGESDLALRGAEKTPEQYIDALTRVKEQTIHTTRLVQDLLFVARTEGGKAPMNKDLEAVVPLVQSICRDFHVIAAERNIDIVDTYADDKIAANIDAGRIKQVVTILLDNAIRYSHKDSTIQVHVEKMDEQFVLTVKDSGIGLSIHDADKVFARFYRGNEGGEATSGTGLGLPVAKAIVDAHGGTITLQGEKDIGTVATVTLPLDTD